MFKATILTLTIAGTALLAGCHEGHAYRHDRYEQRIAVVHPAPHLVVIEQPRHRPPEFRPGPRHPAPMPHRGDRDRQMPRHRR